MNVRRTTTIQVTSYRVVGAGWCGVPGGCDQVDAMGPTTDEQLLHVAGT